MDTALNEWRRPSLRIPLSILASLRTRKLGGSRAIRICLGLNLACALGSSMGDSEREPGKAGLRVLRIEALALALVSVVRCFVLFLSFAFSVLIHKSLRSRARNGIQRQHT